VSLSYLELDLGFHVAFGCGDWRREKSFWKTPDMETPDMRTPDKERSNDIYDTHHVFSTTREAFDVDIT